MKIIAELGVNYNSDEEIIQMLDKCQELNIPFAKLQLFTKDMVPTELRHTYIDKKRAKKIYKAGQERNVEVFFSVMYLGGFDICEEVGVKYYKLRFMDRNNLILYRRLKKIKNFQEKTIFVSCQDPKNTIFYNMAKHRGNIRFLYVIPKYPAKYKQYAKASGVLNIDGFSDHTVDLELFEYARGIGYPYFEMHVCLECETAYEGEWSKNFEKIKEVL
jgi:sialic acid synthase SpsE